MQIGSQLDQQSAAGFSSLLVVLDRALTHLQWGSGAILISTCCLAVGGMIPCWPLPMPTNADCTAAAFGWHLSNAGCCAYPDCPSFSACSCACLQIPHELQSAAL